MEVIAICAGFVLLTLVAMSACRLPPVEQRHFPSRPEVAQELPANVIEFPAMAIVGSEQAQLLREYARIKALKDPLFYMAQLRGWESKLESHLNRWNRPASSSRPTVS